MTVNVNIVQEKHMTLDEHKQTQDNQEWWREDGTIAKGPQAPNPRYSPFDLFDLPRIFIFTHRKQAQPGKYASEQCLSVYWIFDISGEKHVC